MKSRRQVPLQSHCSDFLRGMVLLKCADSFGFQEDSMHAPKAYIVLETLDKDAPEMANGLRVTVADSSFRTEALLPDRQSVEALRCRNRIRRTRGGHCCWVVYLVSSRVEVESERICFVVDDLTTVSDHHDLVTSVLALPELSQDEEIVRLLRKDRISASQAIVVLDRSCDSIASWDTAVSATSREAAASPRNRREVNNSTKPSTTSNSSSSSSSGGSGSGSDSDSSSDGSEDSFRTAVTNARPSSPHLMKCIFRDAAPEPETATMNELKIPQEALDVFLSLPVNLDSTNFSSSEVQPSSCSSALVVSSLSATAFSQQSLGLEINRLSGSPSPQKRPSSQEPADPPAQKQQRTAEDEENSPPRNRSPREAKQVSFQTLETARSFEIVQGRERASSTRQEALNSDRAKVSTSSSSSRGTPKSRDSLSTSHRKTSSLGKTKEASSALQQESSNPSRSSESVSSSPQRTPTRKAKESSSTLSQEPSSLRRSTRTSSSRLTPKTPTPQKVKASSSRLTPKTPTPQKVKASSSTSSPNSSNSRRSASREQGAPGASLLTEDSSGGGRLLGAFSALPQSTQRHHSGYEAFLRTARGTLRSIAAPVTRSSARTLGQEKLVNAVKNWALT